LLKIASSKHSSTSWAYYLNDIDITEKRGYNYMEIETALELDPQNSVLVFFDDGAYSGSQVVSIFQEMMGIPVNRRTTNETHGHTLNARLQTKIKEFTVIIAYLCFNQESKSFITSELKNLGIDKITFVHETELDNKIFDSANTSVFSDSAQKSLLEKVFFEIGESVLRSSKKNQNNAFKPGWDDARVNRSALGYNNAQQIIVFERNIPTYTLTALWANGLYKNSEWRGLFQRTNKD
jgi:hypothetical protein